MKQWNDVSLKKFHIFELKDIFLSFTFFLFVYTAILGIYSDGIDPK